VGVAARPDGRGRSAQGRVDAQSGGFKTSYPEVPQYSHKVMCCQKAAYGLHRGIQRSRIVRELFTLRNSRSRTSQRGPNNKETDVSTVSFFSIAMLTAVLLAMSAQVASSQSNMSAHIPHGNTSGQSSMSAHVPHGNTSGQSNMSAHIPHGSTSGQSNMSDVHSRH
jgi:hypothetical protein